VPTPGLELKLAPVEGKIEVRYKGPNITPGYWRDDEATRECFDDEGFFRTGDAVLWIDEGDIHQGLKFDGRIAEDFKLGTGTFVSVGSLRAKIAAAGAPHVQDAVITGINLKEMVCGFPTQSGASLAGLPADAALQDAGKRPGPGISRRWWTSWRQRGSSSRRLTAPDGRAALRQGRNDGQGSINQRRASTDAAGPARRNVAFTSNRGSASHERSRTRRHRHLASVRRPRASWRAGSQGGPARRQRRSRQKVVPDRRRPAGATSPDTASVTAALAQATAAHGAARVPMNTPGSARPGASWARTAAPHPEDFARVININLIGSIT
jgi:hypothetical protein